MFQAPSLNRKRRSSEDAFGVSGPDEGFGIGVGFFDEPVDCPFFGFKPPSSDGKRL
jgi:hypothetical protein